MKSKTLPIESSTDKRLKIIAKIQAAHKAGSTIQQACKASATPVTAYYRWKKQLEGTNPTKKPRKKLFRKLKAQVPAELPTPDASIPVMLVKLTPSQLAAFFQG